MITLLGEFLRNIRLERNELLRQMAIKLNITSAELSAIEHGKANITEDIRTKLMLYYDVEPDTLAELESEVTANNDKAIVSKATTLYEMIKSNAHQKTIDYTCNGDCSGCGSCCSNMLPVSKEEIDKIKKYVKTHNIKPHQIALPLSGPIVDATCPFLDNTKEKDRCKIYPVRPLVCQCFTCHSTEKTIQNAMDNNYEDKRPVINMKETFFQKKTDCHEQSVTYKGYTATQTNYNYHVNITKDNRCVCHATCNKRKTQDELRDMIDTYIEFSKIE